MARGVDVSFGRLENANSYLCANQAVKQDRLVAIPGLH